MKTLISVDEIIHSSAVSTNSEGVYYNNFAIKTLESELFNEHCLGFEFYKNMLESQRTACQWNNTTSYEMGNIVKHEACFFEAKQDTTAQAPPQFTAIWQQVSKFTNDCYEQFWCEHLRDYLASKITNYLRPISTYRQTEHGTTRFEGENRKAVNLEQLKYVKASEANLIAKSLEQMKAYLQRHPTCFPLYKGNQTENCASNIEKTCGTTEQSPWFLG
ncbi:MAG: hypothetical protein ACPG5B_02290 [Chitinophagales bacterium]